MSTEATYQERLARIQKAVNLEPVDRIPVVYMGVAFSPRYMGMPMSQFCTDPEAAFHVTIAALDRLGAVDGINLAPVGRIAAALSGLWLSHVAIPGRELPEDSLWQVQEAEIMSIEDYDTIIDQGWQAFLGTYMPKIVDMGEYMGNLEWMGANMPRLLQELKSRGYVAMTCGAASIPFEYFCGGRSMEKFFIDLHRIPDKVQAAMDAIVPDLVGTGAMIAGLSGIPALWVGGWRSASALVAPRLWDRFVFPYFQQVVTALAEQGITSILHLDQNWNRDLARLRDLPAKKCIINPDGMTDVRKIKEVLGDRMAIMGDIPAWLLAAGTPDEVYNYTRDLVRDVGPTGLILCPGCDAPINSRPENMEAFVAAGRDFGLVVSRA